MTRVAVPFVALLLVACGGGDDNASPLPSGADASTAGDGSIQPDAHAGDDTATDASVAVDSAVGADAASDGGPLSVALRFAAKVGTKAFSCGTTYAGQGSTGVTVQPRDFRFYVQDVRLVDAAGNEVPVTLDARSPWQTPTVALLDFENGTGACSAEGNAEMNDVVTGTVPPGTYTGIVFRNGVPDALNHADPLNAPAPLQPAPMTWGWLFGYKFIKAELASTGAPSGDAAPGLGLFHLGSTGCTNALDGGDPDFMNAPLAACAIANRNTVRLTGYRLGASVIVADIGALFQGIDLSTDNQCHSGGDACPSMFAAAGVGVVDGAPLATQSLYRLE